MTALPRAKNFFQQACMSTDILHYLAAQIAVNSFYQIEKCVKTKSHFVLTNEQLPGVLSIATSIVAADVDFLCT